MEMEPNKSFEIEKNYVHFANIKSIGEKNSIRAKTWDESKKMWEIAGPAILTTVAQFSIGFVTIAFVGHLGEVELAAVSVVQNLGMGSALETLCGQAVGAGQYEMLGIYMQRSCIITIVTAFLLTPLYIFTSPILNLLRQDREISDLAGKYALWVIPHCFLGFHVVLNWILVTKLGKGLVGAAIAENISWWLVVLAQIVYVVSGFFPESWTGFSSSAFKSLYSFVKLSLASALMLCLELWYYTVVILMVGWLKNPEIAVDAISICMNLELWTLMITLGFNAAISVRVSNELGANNPKAAKFSVVVSVVTSTLFGVVFTAAILATRDYFPRFFSGTFSGVAVGAGWQLSVALINVGCYYVFGLPFGALLGYKFDLGVKGIWLGMLAGCLLQTVILILYVLRANWSKEALHAEERLRCYATTPLPQNESTENGTIIDNMDKINERTANI
ncbi:hypothetical protein DH2020_029449 [Rehmannia glutinosa]|uniref:Protein DETOXIFICATION n=1 Tax=Rehmannia glutinosa TaxID=99300 RepID=A0ABR0VRV5_REHGL